MIIIISDQQINSIFIFSIFLGRFILSVGTHYKFYNLTTSKTKKKELAAPLMNFSKEQQNGGNKNKRMKYELNKEKGEKIPFFPFIYKLIICLLLFRFVSINKAFIFRLFSNLFVNHKQ